MVMVVLNQAQFRHVAFALVMAENGIENRRRRRR